MSDPATYDLDSVVWKVTKSVFSYVELMGVETPDFSKLQLAHQAGLEFLKVAGVEAVIFSAQTLSEKVKLMAEYRDQISAITKISVVEEVVNSRDLALKLAVAELLSTVTFSNEPAELRGLIERSLPVEEREVEIRNLKIVSKLAQMSKFEALVFKFNNFDDSATQTTLRQAKQYLAEWGIA